ncbi:MAG: hypothetical protein HS108_02565 [Planctomycetes bacterium]|jgi:hypothetical protein|nr:hypothetical protein [Planctomycetota bacterium]MCL4729199.1 hypothetical protein [Planctomycetota bacterium]
MIRKLRGSKAGGDYCWSAFTCENPAPPWYLRTGAKPQDPPPEDSREVPQLPPQNRDKA